MLGNFNLFCVYDLKPLFGGRPLRDLTKVTAGWLIGLWLDFLMVVSILTLDFCKETLLV